MRSKIEPPHERFNGRGSRPRAAKQGRSPAPGSCPAPAADSRRLSGADKAGSMPDGERNVKDGGESP